MSDSADQILAAIQLYAKAGFHLFPVWGVQDGQCMCGRASCKDAGKHPIPDVAPHGVKDATNEIETLRQWWKKYPFANIGVAYGPSSGSWILDVDGSEGEASLAKFEAEHGALPPRPEIQTGREDGGRHLMFAWPTDGRIVRNAVGGRGRMKDYPGLDVRGQGGYGILPPSTHASGGVYRWSVRQEEVPSAPEALLKLVCATAEELKRATPGVVAPPVPPGASTRHGLGALRQEVEALRTSIQPGRNHQLNASAFKLGSLVAGGEIEEDLVRQQVIQAARDCGLGEREIQKTFESGFRAGLAQPRSAARSAEFTHSSSANGTACRRTTTMEGDATGNGVGSDDQPCDPTDTDNAARLVDLHGPHLHYVPTWTKWLVWDCTEGRWVLDRGDVRVRELAKDVGRDLLRDLASAAKDLTQREAANATRFAFRSLSSIGISGMVNLARGISGIPLEHEALDANPWLLGVRNGVIDLRTGTLRPADPADLITMQCPVVWDPRATAPRWERALREWFPDEKVRKYVQRVAGAALVGKQHDHIFVIHFGAGRNGKGRFLAAIFRVLGPYARVIDMSLIVDTGRDEHATVRAELFRARLAAASEGERRVRLKEASIKSLTGGDRIKARRMREDSWEFDPTHSLWFISNYLPSIAGRDLGIWSRVRVVPWTETFKGKEEDKHLDDKLSAEAGGILRWLVEGCLEWQQTGLDEPEAVKAATLAYQRAEDKLSLFAEAVGLTFRKDLKITVKELGELLTEWSEEQGIRPPKRELKEWLEAQGAHQDRDYAKTNGMSIRARTWFGVGTCDDREEQRDKRDNASGCPRYARAWGNEPEDLSHVSHEEDEEEEEQACEYEEPQHWEVGG